MAAPITPTPVLKGKEAANFLRMLLEDQAVKIPLKSYPNLKRCENKFVKTL
jgi:hypothetical protein